jgi:hypothetical protein
MNNSNLFLATIIFVLYVGVIIVGGVFISKLVKKYNQHIIAMKKNGSYTEWAKRNKTLLFFARLANYVILFCFAGFIFLSIIKTSGNVAVLINLVFPFLLISIALHLILYFKLPKNQD